MKLLSDRKINESTIMPSDRFINEELSRELV